VVFFFMVLFSFWGCCVLLACVVRIKLVSGCVGFRAFSLVVGCRSEAVTLSLSKGSLLVARCSLFDPWRLPSMFDVECSMLDVRYLISYLLPLTADC
jgi:hypothetical protein